MVERLPSSMRRRKRTVSLSSVSSAQPKITLGVADGDAALVPLYLSVAETRGSFIPTPSARAALQCVQNLSMPIARPFGFTYQKRPRFVWSDDDSPSSSGPPSPTIHHTASPFSEAHSPASTSSTTLVDPHSPSLGRKSSSELDPILAKLERKSRLLSQGVRCSTCRKTGSGYPKCGRCNAMWCSRECRLEGGKRHVCS